MKIACLDLEGVLVPEIWINVAKHTKIDALRRTTREEPDYDVLMKGRLDILEAHGLKLQKIQEVISGLTPLPGAREFLDWLRTRFQVVILSDTFYEFADPLMAQLGRPTLLCHRLETDAEGRVVDYHLRLPDQKRCAVKAFQELAFEVVAAGDSYNDTSMLEAADHGFLFKAPENVKQEFPKLPAFETYEELREAFDAVAD